MPGLLAVNCLVCSERLHEDEHVICHWHTSHYSWWSRGNRIACDFFHRGIILTPQQVEALEETL